MTTSDLGAGGPRTLSVIVVNWNACELLRECLRSLGRQLVAPWRVEVLVVDNDSSDGSREMVAAEFPDVKLIRNERNVGFAAANNLGLALAAGEYVLLLNPDTVLREPVILRQWLSFMENNPAAGASGCKLVFPDGRHQYGDAGFRPTLATLVGYASLLAKAFPARFRGLFHDFSARGGPVEVDWICGAGLLVRARTIRTVGGLDERIFMFAEDIEWCCRIRDAGDRVFYLPHLTIEHHQGGSVRKQRNQKVFSVLWLKNLRALYAKYNPGHPQVVFDGVMIGGYLLRAALHALRYAATFDPFSLERSRAMYRYARAITVGLDRPR